ncbi:hypothetical protein [Actinomadura rudentiformis]|uniref:Uncharacterized protein n=1 Tax=Actinomadura rudentiformis TaxID=359158 RepID=A0A6H9YC16_9ACTN|nr:hypothetical protein [Actinomadura rudentiformis]KAB2342622.1 hypothetical protein F8566_36850 [Actinomadura rudentiformis]
MSHWHFTRTRVDLAANPELDLFMFLDQFPDAAAATLALAADVVNWFPFLKAKKSLADTVEKMPEHGERAAYIYRPSETALVQWSLRECMATTCAETLAAYEREIKDNLTKTHGISVTTVSRPPSMPTRPTRERQRRKRS